MIQNNSSDNIMSTLEAIQQGDIGSCCLPVRGKLCIENSEADNLCDKSLLLTEETTF